MGRKGIQEVAHQCAQKAAYAAKKISALPGFALPFSGARFNEFVVRGPIGAGDLLARLAKEKGIDGGIALSRFWSGYANDFLVCVTETNTRDQIDALVDGLQTLSNPN
jgi:glycine dehydrogenase subunit 1